MYYFRDSYFDQQIAYGIARSGGRLRRKPLSTPRRVWNTATQLLLSFTCLFVTFVIGYMVMDVLGLEHLIHIPELDAIAEVIEMLTPSAVSF